MSIQLSTAVRNSMLDALAAAVDGGTGAIIEVYTGTPPGVGNATTGTKLATLTMSTTAFAAASGGVLQEATITADSSADSTGTPGYARVLTQVGGTAVIECDAAVGSGSLNFSAGVTLGGTVSISDFAITCGNA